MTIQAMMYFGFVAGLIVGIVVAKPKLGCLTLLAIPIAMIVYIGWWQSQNPDMLRSTSALDFMFGPLWPSLGAIGGFSVGRLARWLVLKT